MIKKISKHALLIIVLFLALFARRQYFIHTVCEERGLFAHGGGYYEGYYCTNSLEAVGQSIRNHCKYIELDLLLTSDSIVVASHDWATLNHQCSIESESAMTLGEFSSVLVHGCLHPMTWQMIDSVFTSNDSIVLVTDKISSPDVIRNNFRKLKDRMLIETFTYDDYIQLDQDGYHPMISSVMPNKDILRLLLTYYGNNEPGIVVSMEGYESRKAVMTLLSFIRPFYYALFAAKSTIESNKIFQSVPNAKFVYVDQLKDD